MKIAIQWHFGFLWLSLLPGCKNEASVKLCGVTRNLIATYHNLALRIASRNVAV